MCNILKIINSFNTEYFYPSISSPVNFHMPFHIVVLSRRDGTPHPHVSQNHNIVTPPTLAPHHNLAKLTSMRPRPRTRVMAFCSTSQNPRPDKCGGFGYMDELVCGLPCSPCSNRARDARRTNSEPGFVNMRRTCCASI
jgi:hypothetical protein